MFNQVHFKIPKKNVFNLSHEKKLTCKMGRLVPIMCEEVIPGDTWQMNSEILMRLAPMLAPVMHRVDVHVHNFFVPNRLIWNEWEDFITGGEDGTANPVMPYLKLDSGAIAGSLADYLGCPTNTDWPTTANINALPFRAYHTIYNEYYRDQNLQDKTPVAKTSGEDPNTIYMINTAVRAWEKDYFTSALPWTQRGGQVEIPLLGSAPVVLADNTDWASLKNTNRTQATDSALRTEQGNLRGAGDFPLVIDPNGSLEADLTDVTSATIAELRNAVKLQEWLEKNARGGSRYIEQIKQHFGVTSSDARLQRPEYLGGGKTPIVMSEVLQTSSTDSTSPQANMSGHGVSAGSSMRWRRSFEEHGYIISIMSVLPKTAYMQGFRRHFLKDDKFQYFWPEFAHIGEQEVMKSELYHDYTTAPNKEAFGYQSRYSEYKFIPSSVHGDFKESLLYWHMGRKFSSMPNLNSQFITSDATERIFAVEDNSDKCYVQIYNDVKAIRPIPRFSNPSL
jgi:hypothetical protein